MLYLDPRAESEAFYEENDEGKFLRRFAHNLRRESIFFIFSLITH